MMPFYKAVRPDRCSHYDSSTRWRKGSIVRIKDPDPPEVGACGRGIHCSPSILGAVQYQRWPSRYCVVQPLDCIANDSSKQRCSAVRVLRWLSPREVDKAAQFRLWEANYPVNPLMLRTTRLSNIELQQLVHKWASVWDSVWDSVGDSVWASVRTSVWDSVRNSVWDSVWDSVGDSVRNSVRDSVWASVGASVRASVWASVWASVRDSVWASVRASVGAYIGGLFPRITEWKYTSGRNPWKPLLTLWYAGYVPSYDGRIWRLHAGKDAKVVLEWTPEATGVTG